MSDLGDPSDDASTYSGGGFFDGLKSDLADAEDYVANKAKLAGAYIQDAENPYNIVAVATGGDPIAVNVDAEKFRQAQAAGDVAGMKASTGDLVTATTTAATDPNNTTALGVLKVTDQANKGIDAAESGAGTAFKLLTNPWVLGGAAVLVGLAVLAPYLSPILRRV